MSNILVKCDRACLESMLNVLKGHLPQRIHQYNSIYSYLYHYDKINGDREDRWNVHLYKHREGQLENCTLVQINEKQSRPMTIVDYTMLCFTLQESEAELKECLLEANLINWLQEPFNILCDESLFTTVKEVACQRLSSIDWRYPPPEEVMHITKEKIAALPLNENVSADFFVAPQANIINDLWECRDLHYLHGRRRMGELIRRLESQPTLEHTKITMNEFLAPSAHQLSMKGELKLLLTIYDMDLLSFVAVDQKTSLDLHRELGFVDVSRVTWIRKPLRLNFR